MHFSFNFIEHKISGRMQGQNVLFASVSIQYLQLRQWADRQKSGSLQIFLPAA